jgi:hypothetical protein
MPSRLTAIATHTALPRVMDTRLAARGAAAIVDTTLSTAAHIA